MKKDPAETEPVKSSGLRLKSAVESHSPQDDFARCPHCQRTMPAGAIICTSCGFNFTSGRQTRLRYQPPVRFSPWRLVTGLIRWALLLAFLGAIGIMALAKFQPQYLPENVKIKLKQVWNAIERRAAPADSDPNAAKPVKASVLALAQAVSGSLPEPNWTNRARILLEQFKVEFAPPPTGQVVTITLHGNKKMEGTLVAVTATSVDLRIPSGRVSLARETIHADTRGLYFAQDYATARTRAILLSERAVFAPAPPPTNKPAEPSGS